jgi:hypothetical protein
MWVAAGNAQDYINNKFPKEDGFVFLSKAEIGGSMQNMHSVIVKKYK